MTLLHLCCMCRDYEAGISYLHKSGSALQHVLQYPSPAGLVALFMTMKLHLYLMQKASALSHVTAMEGVLQMCVSFVSFSSRWCTRWGCVCVCFSLNSRGEKVSRDLTELVSFFKMVSRCK